MNEATRLHDEAQRAAKGPVRHTVDDPTAGFRTYDNKDIEVARIFARMVQNDYKCKIEDSLAVTEDWARGLDNNTFVVTGPVPATGGVVPFGAKGKVIATITWPEDSSKNPLARKKKPIIKYDSSVTVNIPGKPDGASLVDIMGKAQAEHDENERLKNNGKLPIGGGDPTAGFEYFSHPTDKDLDYKEVVKIFRNDLTSAGKDYVIEDGRPIQERWMQDLCDNAETVLVIRAPIPTGPGAPPAGTKGTIVGTIVWPKSGPLASRMPGSTSPDPVVRYNSADPALKVAMDAAIAQRPLTQKAADKQASQAQSEADKAQKAAAATAATTARVQKYKDEPRRKPDQLPKGVRWIPGAKTLDKHVIHKNERTAHAQAHHEIHEEKKQERKDRRERGRSERQQLRNDGKIPSEMVTGTVAGVAGTAALGLGWVARVRGNDEKVQELSGQRPRKTSVMFKAATVITALGALVAAGLALHQGSQRGR